MNNGNYNKPSKLENLKLFYEELPDNGLHPVTGEPHVQTRGNRISRPRRTNR